MSRCNVSKGIARVWEAKSIKNGLWSQSDPIQKLAPTNHKLCNLGKSCSYSVSVSKSLK